MYYVLCPVPSYTDVVGSGEISVALCSCCRCGPECDAVGNVLVMEMDVIIDYLQ